MVNLQWKIPAGITTLAMCWRLTFSVIQNDIMYSLIWCSEDIITLRLSSQLTHNLNLIIKKNQIDPKWEAEITDKHCSKGASLVDKEYSGIYLK